MNQLEGSGTATRAQMYGLLLAGTMTGLPIPTTVNFDRDGFHLTFDRNDRAAVDAWATFFGLPAPSEVDFSGHPGYSAHGFVAAAPTPWRAVRCELDQADADAEATG